MHPYGYPSQAIYVYQHAGAHQLIPGTNSSKISSKAGSKPEASLLRALLEKPTSSSWHVVPCLGYPTGTGSKVRFIGIVTIQA